MKQADELSTIIGECDILFKKISRSEWEQKPVKGGWSKKEILGHLIDSALTNLRRFIVTQYQQNEKVVYQQDEWVNMQNYQDSDIDGLIILWKALNQRIVTVINNIPSEKLNSTCDTGKDTVEKHTLQFLIDDYIVHLKHHLVEISH